MERRQKRSSLHKFTCKLNAINSLSSLFVRALSSLRWRHQGKAKTNAVNGQKGKKARNLDLGNLHKSGSHLPDLHHIHTYTMYTMYLYTALNECLSLHLMHVNFIPLNQHTKHRERKKRHLMTRRSSFIHQLQFASRDRRRRVAAISDIEGIRKQGDR